MDLLLVRHGDAHAGLTGTIAGPTGCAGLTPRGRAQAAALRDRLADSGARVDILMASVLPRAIETAEIIAPALGFTTVSEDCDLCEVHTGDADGLDWAVYTERFGALDMPAEPDRIFAPGGESWNGFHQRVHDMVERIARDHAGQTVMAVCHAGVITATLTTILGVRWPGPGARLRPTNTGLTHWTHDPVAGAWTLQRFNDAAHLEKGTSP